MLRRFVTLIVIGLVVEGAIFAVRYRDLLTVRHRVYASSASPATRDEFVLAAHEVLRRPKLTRDTLELLARQAQALGEFDLEARALDAAVRLDPGDATLALRSADAFRRAGDLRRADERYQAVLQSTDGGAP
ncbi:MAG: tetratricopeptide repeat protein [Vicinamibacterales bacterium]